MKHSDDRKSLMISTRTGASSNCFSSIFQRLACGGNAISPTPPDSHHRHNLVLPAASNPSVGPDQSEPTSSSSSQLVDHSGSFEAARPGLVARLMGLESVPDPVLSKDSVMNLRSKSLNSLHWYIFPDTFLDHVSPAAQSFSQQPKRQPSHHRRSQTSSSVLCVEKFDAGNVKSTASKKSDKKGPVKGRREALEGTKYKGPVKGRREALEGTKYKVGEDHGRRRCRHRKDGSMMVNRKDGSMMVKKCDDGKRREIKYTDFGTKLRKEKRIKSGPSTSSNNKDDSARRRRKQPRKIKTDGGRSTDAAPVQRHDQERNSAGFDQETEEWVILDESVKGLGVVFAGQLLEVLIDEFLDEVLV